MKFQLKARVFYKYGTIYREVMHTPLMNWCDMPLSQTSNPMIKQLIKFANDIDPNLVHSCPYTVIVFYLDI